jgi:hypothetical protein
MSNPLHQAAPFDPPVFPDRSRALAVLERPAWMPEHRDARRDTYELGPAPVRAPHASGVSDDDTRHENRRLKEKREHGLHPVIPPRLSIAPIGRHHDFKCGKLTLHRLARRLQTIRANSHGEIMTRFAVVEKPD